MGIHIRTNHAPRDIIYGFELTDAERAEHDYLTGDELWGASFVRYRGRTYYLGDFTSATGEDNPLATLGWDGFFADSAFSGIFIKIMPDCERVICATYCA